MGTGGKAMLSAAEVIALLDLKPLPHEGGFFRETYRSAVLHDHHAGDRSLCTAIYYLLTRDTFSALHRLPSDELFHFYLGDPVTMLQLGPDGGRLLTLGPDLQAGQRLQVLVPAGVWQGSLVQPGGAWALMGTTMAPGFDFGDYEAGNPQLLAGQYPDFAELIRRLCRDAQ
jgi:hypothetical protein